MIPAFVAPTFDLAALEADEATLVIVDAKGVILWVNAAWRRFAMANGGEDVLQKYGPGSSYLQAIPEPLRTVYEKGFAQAFATGEPFELDYDCSSPEVFRIYHARALPIAGQGLLVEHSLRVERPHEPGASDPFASEYVRANGLILQCANCRRVCRRDATTWDWLPSWIHQSPSNTSHGICPHCISFYWGVSPGSLAP